MRHTDGDSRREANWFGCLQRFCTQAIGIEKPKLLVYFVWTRRRLNSIPLGEDGDDGALMELYTLLNAPNRNEVAVEEDRAEDGWNCQSIGNVEDSVVYVVAKPNAQSHCA